MGKRTSKVLAAIRGKVREAEKVAAQPRPTVINFDMKLTPFSHYRLYADEKYSLQNMVLKMVSYPAKVDTAVDQTFSVYSDRAHTAWYAATRLIESKASGDAWFEGVSDKDFLLFAGKLFAMLNTPKPCTGDEYVQNVNRYSNKFQSRVAELSGSKALAGIEENDDNRYREYLDLSIKTREWAEKQAAQEIEPLAITGALMVRCTNVASGYPCPVVMAVVQKSDFPTYSGNAAPFIDSGMGRRDFMDRYGNPRWGRGFYNEDGEYA